jgi:16S rRNA (cytosine967-C5)-methyltransferase
LETRKAEQDRVLAQAADHVKPGGRLAYVTCSVFREENRDRIAAFLESRPDFSVLDHAALLEATFPGRSGQVRVADHGIVLSPSRTGTDGFFFAGLTRLG